jgi:hypothetical protein
VLFCGGGCARANPGGSPNAITSTITTNVWPHARLARALPLRFVPLMSTRRCRPLDRTTKLPPTSPRALDGRLAPSPCPNKPPSPASRSPNHTSLTSASNSHVRRARSTRSGNRHLNVRRPSTTSVRNHPARSPATAPDNTAIAVGTGDQQAPVVSSPSGPPKPLPPQADHSAE